MEVILNDYGQYLGTKKGESLAIFEKRQLTKEVEIFKVDNVYLFEGNSVSTIIREEPIKLAHETI